ncbi:MAG: hypothetical protein M0R76_03735 [Proteobacteria bacterium]|nr:hypothetical protein [Pseudomonadota bacterium]
MNGRTNDTAPVLLIIDDESAVCRALKRTFRDQVSSIVVASNAADAQAIVAQEMVTHVLCDQWLGPGQPLGTELVRGWKAQHASIRRILILTGTLAPLVSLPGDIDMVLTKTTDPVEMAAHLLLVPRKDGDVSL